MTEPMTTEIRDLAEAQARYRAQVDESGRWMSRIDDLVRGPFGLRPSDRITDIRLSDIHIIPGVILTLRGGNPGFFSGFGSVRDTTELKRLIMGWERSWTRANGLKVVLDKAIDRFISRYENRILQICASESATGGDSMTVSTVEITSGTLTVVMTNTRIFYITLALLTEPEPPKLVVADETPHTTVVSVAEVVSTVVAVVPDLVKRIEALEAVLTAFKGTA